MSKALMVQKFEQNFFERTYPSVINDISVAFSEIVANAWDAGATKINISLPENWGDEIVIQDNGSGMTENEFNNRWMVIAYNRVAHQGEYIEYPTERGKIRRLAYGRNGVGRHAMLCFDDSYTIETCKDNKRNIYKISVNNDDTSAFSVVDHSTVDCEDNGTKLIVNARKKLPTANELKRALSYRFLFDPEFEIYINGELVDYQQYTNAVVQEKISVNNDEVEIIIYEVPEGEKTIAENGIAFWVGKRLVGNPDWVIGGLRVEDARRKFALNHIIVVQADFLHGDVKYDWSGFNRTQNVIETQKAITAYVRKFRTNYYRGRTEEVRGEVIKQNLDEIEKLSIPSRYDLKEFFDSYLEEKPEVDSDELNLIIQALINVLQSRNGLSLLSKLATLNSEQLNALDDILAEWSIFDIRTVLDEIDGRLKVISAIETLCADRTVDELHTLHPLVTQAKWLFGIEYDTINYTSNRTLSTVMKEFFQNKKNVTTEINWSKRPDLVIAADFSVGVSSVDEFDENEILKVSKILIIELKKGGFEIKRDEMNQAEEYVDFIYNGNTLNAKPHIKAFVVGNSINTNIGNKKTLSDSNQHEYGEVRAYTYMELARTAEKRLLNLKDKLSERYNQMGVDDYLQKILNEPKQLKMNV
ncbi:hypothetical protein AGMMS49983_01190 [Clostridia bacterium]|nr:hypothetical protein AGMMS49983_01190 [Clostridia bacterium]